MTITNDSKNYSFTYPRLKTKDSDAETCTKTCLAVIYQLSSNLTEKIRFWDSFEHKKKLLSEIGFKNPETFYQTNKENADLALRLLELFKKQGIHLICDETEEKLITYDGTSLDLSEIQRNHRSQIPSAFVPAFYSDKQTLYCNLHNPEFSIIKFQTPSIEKWTRHLKSPSIEIAQGSDPLNLPSGNVFPQKGFVEHPLFKYTLEKYNVFRFLISFTKEEAFQKNYDDFLKNIKQENWIEPYLSDPKSLTLFSLIAFLENQIPEQDLFVIHMAASALAEASENSPVHFTILREETAADYLKSAHYPPFADSFYTNKTKEELEDVKQKILSNLKKKSPVQRTAISYTISDKQDCSSKDYSSIEERIFYNLNFLIGYHQDISQNTVVLLPPSFCLELYQSTSSEEPPPSTHTWMFGFNNDETSLNTFKIGRSISIASPLFKLPYVHEYTKGKQLGITMHDVLYHLSIDWQNPHSELFIQIGKALIKNGHDITGIAFLDREFNCYRNRAKNKDSPLHAFWRAISHISERRKLAFIKELFFSILEDILPPEFWNLEVLGSLIDEYKEKAQTNNPTSKTINFSRAQILTFFSTRIKDFQLQQTPIDLSQRTSKLSFRKIKQVTEIIPNKVEFESKKTV